MCKWLSGWKWVKYSRRYSHGPNLPMTYGSPIHIHPLGIGQKTKKFNNCECSLTSSLVVIE